MKRLVTLGLIGLALYSCTAPSTDLVGVSPGNAFLPDRPYAMVKVPSGAYTMGANDQNVPYAQTTPVRTVTMHSYWMDQTEITNNEYRQFVHWVRDSIARVYLAENGVEGYERIEENEDGDFIENPPLNWTTPIEWNSDDEIFQDALLPMKSENMFGAMGFDPTLYNYSYTYVDNSILGKVDPKSEGFNMQSMIKTGEVPVYPDTTVWLKDFAYAYTQNEPIFTKYFWHPSYGDYPVVGVTWEQANAFCNWRTDLQNSGLYKSEVPYETSFRLPTEAEWEYAARGGKQKSIYPWGGLYSTSSKGCFLANFKPRRGEYGADGHIFTAPANAFETSVNDWGLFNMSGNVAEWTSTPFEQSQYSFWHDLNPEYKFDADANAPKQLKRKVIKGGSWKDIGAFIQIAARDYEYQDNATSFIGFRCVKTEATVREFE
ncbi:MAG: SUMF1/EgtB/PvdO family nonheme iron enzyme [Flavobacteriales bacterium]